MNGFILISGGCAVIYENSFILFQPCEFHIVDFHILMLKIWANLENRHDIWFGFRLDMHIHFCISIWCFLLNNFRWNVEMLPSIFLEPQNYPFQSRFQLNIYTRDFNWRNKKNQTITCVLSIKSSLNIEKCILFLWIDHFYQSELFHVSVLSLIFTINIQASFGHWTRKTWTLNENTNF